jgi:hypothetical protein
VCLSVDDPSEQADGSVSASENLVAQQKSTMKLQRQNTRKSVDTLLKEAETMQQKLSGEVVDTVQKATVGVQQMGEGVKSYLGRRMGMRKKSAEKGSKPTPATVISTSSA